MESLTTYMEVRKVENQITHQWLLYKHYAHRLPSISYAFGLFDGKEMAGVCTFGFPPNYEYNNGKCVFDGKISILTLELNRLCVNDGLPKNSLSFFVSRCLKILPTPYYIVSYTDPNNGHHGYIYQATNWIYTGVSMGKTKYTFENGKTFDIRRGIDKKGKIVKEEKMLPTHRYLKFMGSRTQIKEMNKNLKWKILPYPKGDNKKYDAVG